MKVKQAFILCGGKGERLKPLTDDLPKPMVDVKGKPMLLNLVEYLAGFGVKKFVFATGYRAEKIKEFFGDGKKFGVEIKYSHETTALGTGGALKNAKLLLDKSFFMLNGDNLSDVDLEKMEKAHFTKNAAATIALVNVRETKNYGIARLEGDKIKEFVEKPPENKAPSRWANAGLYIMENSCIGLLPDGFCMVEKTLFPALAKHGKLFGFRHEGKWFPTDTIEKLEEARKKY